MKDEDRRVKAGKKRSPHVLEVLREANLGKKHSAETCRKMSEAKRPWMPEDDLLVPTLEATEAADKTGRSTVAVRRRRLKLEGKDIV